MVMRVAQAPWAKKGQDVKLMTMGEALEKADLDWEVGLKDVYVEGTKVEGKHAVVRLRDNKVYSIVGDRYACKQNAIAFDEFQKVSGVFGATVATVGNLDDGRRLWCLSDLGQSIGIFGDEIKKYFILVSSHDGSLGFGMFWTPIRVVCSNTLAMALAGTDMDERFYLRHTAGINAPDLVEKAQKKLGIGEIFFVDFEQKMKLLAATPIKSEEDLNRMLVAAFHVKAKLVDDEEKFSNTIQAQMNRVKERIVIDQGEFEPKLRNTVYEAFNAIAKFTDYDKVYRGETADARLNGAWFGGGKIIKARALDWALAYAK